jgi:Fe-S-cluster containining protein
MTFMYRCSNCGAVLQTTNADPLNLEITRLRNALHDVAYMDDFLNAESAKRMMGIARAALSD